MWTVLLVGGCIGGWLFLAVVVTIVVIGIWGGTSEIRHDEVIE